jgi:hypothetical protein
MKNCRLLFVCVFLICRPCSAAAQQDSQAVELRLKRLEQIVTRLQSVIEKQDQKINALTEENVKLRAPQAAPAGAQVQPAAGAPTRSGSFNPDIGMVANIVGKASESSSDEEGNDRLSVSEIELIIGHDIDPYSRFDATLTFSDYESPEIEEAYASYFGLPFDLNAKLGRLRPKIGKVSSLHLDSLDTVDEPLVVQRYLGVEGLFRTGAEAGVFLPTSGEDFTQQLILGYLEGGVGEDGELLGESRRRPTFYTHLANFSNVSDAASFELGGTYLLGSSDDDAKNEVNAFVLDATLISHLSAQRRLKLQAESFFQHRAEAYRVNSGGSRTNLQSNPLGLYILGDLRLNQRWALGGRFDYVEPIEFEPGSSRDFERAYSAYLTFYQSEFARLRFQYQYAQLESGLNDNRLFLQGTFAVGNHKHSIQ